MKLPRRTLLEFAKFPALATLLWLAACGGGSGGTSPASAGTGTSTQWVQGQFVASRSFAALCAVPRTGIDPSTHQAYPDHNGTALDEKNWLRSWTNELYLWFDEVRDADPAGFTTDSDYFGVLKTMAITASGHPKDKFHFTYPTATWQSLSQSDQEAGYGATFIIIAAKPPRRILVAYTEPNSPASAPSANLMRGTELLTIDGVDVTNATDSASIAILNAGLTPRAAGEIHTFSVQDSTATTPRTITLVSTNVTSMPVQNVHSITAANGKVVGYVLFNDNLATAEAGMVAAFQQLQAAGAQDLILDIRYNGGGLLDIASEVAYMIAGSSLTTGKTFELSQFNSKNPTTNPINGGTIVPLGFHSTTQGLSLSSGSALPTLNLQRVFVLTGSGTCSASESIINGLRGVGIQVIQIGSTTCGKPYAFYPADNCGITYFSIELQGVNAQEFGNYPDGFTPGNTVATEGVLLPGCSVADDFTHALGDASEGVLASALGYLTSGMCPVPPVAVAPMTSIKSFWRRNRIQPQPQPQ